ncbi:MAG TPA: Rrf2 family transcriptional regulator [Gemmatimonadales bacterium]|nr:Rrf2 family transcriptional regulator [Gemmatimonadales bacterium]
MSTSSRFVVALHILTLLETEGGRPVTSAYIAGSVNTNPGVIRRLLSTLARAGLVTAQLGAGGGALLARPARQIRLLDVYRAVESADLFALHHSPPNPQCPVGKHIQPALSGVLRRAERALEGELGHVTVAEVVHSVTARARRPKV